MRFFLATLGIVMVIGTAGPAGGDPDVNGGTDTGDANFLAALQAADIEYSQPDQVIKVAKLVCRMVDNGRSGPEVVTILMARNPELIAERAAQFMAIAERSYCPDQLAPSSTGGAG